MNVITNGAVQVMVDMMRDLMERVMDEAATCADNNGRVTIKSGNIMTGARLAMHQNIGPYGGGCPEIEKSMCAFATQRYTEYHEYLGWEERQAQAIASGAPSIAAPDRSRPAAMKLRPIPDRFVPDHLSHLRGVRGFRPLSYWDY